MKFTRRQLRKLIIETMISPTDLSDRLLADPQIDRRIKRLLSHPDEEEQVRALELVASMYPQYEDEITKAASGVVQRGTPDYKDHFEMETIEGTLRGAGYYHGGIDELIDNYLEYADSWRSGPGEGILTLDEYADLAWNWAAGDEGSRDDIHKVREYVDDPEIAKLIARLRFLDLAGWGMSVNEILIMLKGLSIGLSDVIKFHRTWPPPKRLNSNLTVNVDRNWDYW